MTGRIKVLGGAGGVGAAVVGAIARRQPNLSIVLVDRDVSRAENVAASCEGSVDVEVVDLDHTAALTATCASADAVINTAGPFYRFGRQVLEAVVASGCPRYIDICDDWQPTLEMLKLDAVASKANVTAIIGMGASPGISNLLARAALEQLDEVRVLHTGWSFAASEPSPAEVVAIRERDGARPKTAATIHFVHQFAQPIVRRTAGQDRQVEPLQEVVLDYPGLGPTTVYTVGHPEPITLARNYGLQESANVVVIDRGDLAVLHHVASKYRADLDEDGAADLLRELIDEAAPRRGPDPLPQLFAYAEGLRDTARCTAVAALTRAPAGGMNEDTAIPCAVGAELLLEDEVTVRGVIAPEQAFPPSVFFERLASFLDPPADDWRSLLETAVSERSERTEPR